MFGGAMSTRGRIAVAILLLSAALPVQAQGTYDVSITRFEAPAEITVDHPNSILVAVRNQVGSTPANVQIVVTATQGTRMVTLLDEEHTVQPGSSVTRTVVWRGRDGTPADLAMTGAITLNATATPKTAVGSAEVSDANRADNYREFQREGVEYLLDLQAPPAGDPLQPGDQWTGVVRFKNQGSRAETLAFSVQSTSWPASLGVTSGTYGSTGTEHETLVTVNVPAQADAGQKATLTFAARPTAAPPGFPPFTIQFDTAPAKLTGSITVSTPDQTAAPGSTLRLPVTIQNLHNRPETISITATPPAGTGFSPVSLGGSEFARGQTKTLHLDIPVPSSAPGGQTEWKLSPTDRDGPRPEYNTTFELTVAQTFGVQLLDVAVDGQSPPLRVEPGLSIPLTGSVKNAGNAPAGFTLAIANDPGPGWSIVTQSSEAGGAVTIASGATAPVPAVLQVPSDAPATQHRQVNVVATAGGKLSDPQSIIFEVPAVGFAKLTAPVVNQQIEAGKSITFQVTLTNVGNAQRQFALAVQAPSSGWSYELSPSTPQTLAPAEARTLALTVTAPAQIDPDDSLALAVEATPLFPSGAPDDARGAALGLVASASLPDLGVSWTPPSGTLYAQAPAAARLTVTNAGLAPAPATEVRIAMSSRAGPVEGPAPLAIPKLDPGASWSDNVALPTGIDHLTLEAEVDPDGLIAEVRKDNNTAEIDLTFQTFDIRVEAPTARTVAPGQFVDLSGQQAFRVSNHGSRSETLDVLVHVAPEWMEAQHARLVLAPGQAARVPAEFTVPSHPSTTEAQVTLRAWQVTGSLSAERSTKVQVIDVQPPQFQTVAAEPSLAAIGQAVRLHAVIHDASPITSAEAVLSPPHGPQVRVPLAAVATGFEGSFAPHMAGDWTWHVVAQDAAPQANRGASGTAVLEVTADEAPVMRVVGDAGAARRPGTPIVVQVAHAHPLVEAAWRTGDAWVPMDVVTPLVVPTDGWVDGVHQVAVRVHDAAGAERTHTVQVRLDGSPPVVQQVSFDPAQPTPGDMVAFTARVYEESGLVVARLRLVGAEAAATDHDLLAASGAAETVDGIILLRSSVPWGDAVTAYLDVEDGLGNRASQQVAVETLAQAEQPSLTTAWPAWAMLGALGALIAARRRR